MAPDSPEFDDPGFAYDTKILSQVVFALNIARRQVATYPAEHPAVLPTLQRFLGQLRDLLEFHEELTIGVARDTLLVGPGMLERKNPVYRDLAARLFAANIAAVTFHRNLSSEELLVFLAALSRPPEDLEAAGGIARLLAVQDVHHVRVQEIDYSAFRTSEVAEVTAADSRVEEQKTELVWMQFIDGLLAGDPSDSQAVGTALDPEHLAELVNRRGTREPGGSEADYERTIASYLQQLDRDDLDRRSRMESFSKLADFIQRLEPGVRRRFLNSTFRSLAEREDLADQLLGGLSGDLLLAFLDEVDDPRLSVPPVIVNLIGKLAESRGQENLERQVAPRRGYSEEELKDQIQTLFREDRSALFLSEDYQSFLQSCLQARPATSLDPGLRDELLGTLGSHELETRLCSIILEVVDADPLCEDAQVLQGNLEDLIGYFLQTGDFSALLATHQRLSRHFDESEPFSVPLARNTLAAYAEPDFIAETLASLTWWERDRHPQIRELIVAVGEPFVEPLLEELAGEGSMYLRQFYLLCLQQIGPAARPAITRRLQDERWYVVRNMVILLRSLDDPGVLQAVGRLFVHPHPQVQREVLKTYLHFQDPRAVRYLLKELAENDLQRRLNAVQMARRCHDREVIHRLLQILEGSLSERDLPLHEAIVKTLGEIGDVVALPRLEKLLERRSLLHPLLQKQLKTAIVRSLDNYSDGAGRPLLQRLARGGGELGRLAAILAGRPAQKDQP